MASADKNKLNSFFENTKNYQRLRRALIIYFSRELRSMAEDHEDCADETIARVIKKINDGIEITSEIETDGIEKYTFGVARFVRMEFWKKPRLKSIEDDAALAANEPVAVSVDMIEMWEQKEVLVYFRKCRSQFNDSERALLNGYYIPPPGVKPKDGREKTAAILGISRSILKKRAFRLREKLEDCMKKHLGSGGTKPENSHK